MAYAIIRIGKLKNRDTALSATAHNYRTQDTPNADPAQASRNQELLNHERRNYWDLATARIQELQLPRLRKDAIRCVEVLLTASADGFPREPDGQAKDMRGSKWAEDNLRFLEKKFGRENLVSFTLHQDETTPHIHAVLVPVTKEQRMHEGQRVGAEVRLSCRELFSPGSLRQLQTDYAEAMAPHGFERGIKYSTALHQNIRRYYGAQQMTSEALAEVAAPLVPKAFELTPMKTLERLSPQAYLEREQARMNAYLTEQVAQVNAKLEQVATVAAANTLAHEQAKNMERQLAAGQKRIDKLQEELQQKSKELTDKTAELKFTRQQYHGTIVQVAQGEGLSKEQVDFATKQRALSQQRAERILVTMLAGPVTSGQQLQDALQLQGFTIRKSPSEQLLVRETGTAVQFPLADVQPNSRPLLEQVQQAIERTRAEQQQEKRMQIANDPRSLKATITVVDAEKAERIRAAFEEAGASVWQVRVLEDKRTSLSVAYSFDWKTIEQISTALSKAQRSEGVAVEETYGNQATRTGAVRTLERDRQPPSREQGISM